MRSKIFLLGFLLCIPFSWAAKVNLKAEKLVLDNGLTVLLHENTQAPTVACRLFYATGSVHEKPGQSGLAHMLEHMLFKGTKKIGITDSIADAAFLAQEDSLRALSREAFARQDSASALRFIAQHDSIQEVHRQLFIKDELWESYLNAGGTGLNAYTSALVTAYHVTLPKNKVELFLWLESDRMENAVLREFYPERDVVREERRMRYDDSPTGRYFESLKATFYEAFPYRIPTIGWAEDINNYSRELAVDHYQKYYKPNNAILVFAGDFNSAELIPKIKKYFAPIPRGSEFPPLIMNEPEAAGEKRLVVRRNDSKPRLDMLFHTPAVGSPEIFALDIAENVLNGRSGRLHRRLVEQEQLAVAAGAANNIKPYMSSFELSVILREGVEHQKVEKIVWEELQKLADEPVSDRELQRVRNSIIASQVRSFRNMEHVATIMAYYELYGDWNLVNRWLDEVAQISPAEVQAAVQKYLQRNRATIGYMKAEEP